VRMRLTDLPRLRQIVLLSGLSQRDIAELAGVSPGTIGNLLAGGRTGCSGEVYEQLLNVLGLGVRQAFEPRVSKKAAA
jgi:transcriptional regulator with XRE-family HTH domain